MKMVDKDDYNGPMKRERARQRLSEQAGHDTVNIRCHDRAV